jgi:hypothetical protein
LYVLFLTQQQASAQTHTEVTLMDFVKIKNGKKAEALFFYENNWKVYRELALKKGIIKSYQLLQCQPDSLNNFDLILITVYSNAEQYNKSEENFRSILTQLRPNGPLLLNELKPAEFRENVFVKTTSTMFAPPKKQRRHQQ